MALGNESLELTDAGKWESFPSFAERFVAQIGASVRKKIDGPDIRFWEIEYNGALLRLVYDDYPNGISIEPMDSDGQKAVDGLFKLVKSQSDQSGL